MYGAILSQKLLTVLLAALLACPSWALRDCCCTRAVSRVEAASCCSTRKVETKRNVSPCCAARLKSASSKSIATSSKVDPRTLSCRPVSTCRCHQATTVATLTKPVLKESIGNVKRVSVARPPLWTVQARNAAARILPGATADMSGFDGPAGRCVRLCRWLT